MSRIKRNSVSQVNIHTEAFIYEIQQRPALWDLTSEDYTDTAKKKKIWEEIVQAFYDKDAASKYSETEFCSQLQKKWKNLRDCYSRELKIRRRLGLNSGSRKSSEYIYFDNLSFLENAIIPKTKLEQVEKSSSEVSEIEKSSPEVKSNIVRKKQRKIGKLHVTDEKITKEKVEGSGTTTSYGETSSSSQKEQHVPQEKETEMIEDCDRMFLLSLLDPLKQIPEYARFGVKRKLMELLDNELQLHLENIHPHITITDTGNFHIT